MSDRPAANVRPAGGPEEAALLAREFDEFLGALLPRLLGLESFGAEQRLSGRLAADFIGLDGDGIPVIVEAKVVTPQTERRLREVREQLLALQSAYVAEHQDHHEPRLILAVTSALTPRYIDGLTKANIEVLDGPALLRAAERFNVEPPLQMAMLAAKPWGGRPDPADTLAAQLTFLAPGRATWSVYQRLIADILAYLFCPPLEYPQYEHANATRVNRRDVILANYVDQGFWAFMRAHYDAFYVVVDAKNYSRDVKKNDVLQIANYLSTHGAGLFGMVFTRSGSADSAEITRREQWAFHRKLVLVFNDNDLLQMIADKKAGGSPDTLVRQKIEDFRLGF